MFYNTYCTLPYPRLHSTRPDMECNTSRISNPMIGAVVLLPGLFLFEVSGLELPSAIDFGFKYLVLDFHPMQKDLRFAMSNL